MSEANKNVVGRPERGGKKLGVGIHGSCKFLGASLETTTTGKEVISLKFGSGLKTTEKSIWVPDLNAVVASEGQSIEDARKKEQDRFTGQCYDFIDAFEMADVQAEGLGNFAKKFVEAANALKTTKTCILVLQYDPQYEWARFPNYNWIYPEGVAVPPSDLEKFRMSKPAGKGGHSITDTAATTGGSDNSFF